MSETVIAPRRHRERGFTELRLRLREAFAILTGRWSLHRSWQAGYDERSSVAMSAHMRDREYQAFRLDHRAAELEAEADAVEAGPQPPDPPGAATLRIQAMTIRSIARSFKPTTTKAADV